MPQHTDSKYLIRGTSIIALLTIVSRFFGFIRDLLVARLFGASLIADCFFVAFRIPNLLRSFVAEGALSAAFVPLFAGELKNGRERAQLVLSLVTGFLSLVTVLLTILGIIFAEEVVALIAPGFMKPESASLCIELTRIMLPYIIFVSLVAMLNGALNSVNIFGIAALAQVVMNIILIIGALIAGTMDELNGVRVLAYSVVAGGFIQVLIQIPALKRAGFGLSFNFNIFSKTIRELVLLMLPAILGATVYQISQFLNTLLASMLKTGSVSWLFYADRITQLPIGIFSIALASVLLPSLAKAASDDNKSGFSRQLVDSLRYTSFFIIPVSGLIFYFATPITIVLFERGEFIRTDSLNTAMAIKALALGLWAVSCYSMIARGFIARKDTVTPTLAGTIVLIVGVIFALLFMGPTAPAESTILVRIVLGAQAALLQIFPSINLEHAGLALSSSLSSFVGFIILMLVFSLRNKELSWAPFLISTIKSLAATLAAMAICMQITFTYETGIFNLVLSLTVYLLLYLIISGLLKNKELMQTQQLLLQKFRNR